VRLQGSPELEEHLSDKGLTGDQLKAAQKMFMVTFEERDQLLRPIAESGQEAVGSMGMIPQWQYCHVKCAMYLISSVSSLHR
jgi:hypothetical protein